MKNSSVNTSFLFKRQKQSFSELAEAEEQQDKFVIDESELKSETSWLTEEEREEVEQQPELRDQTVAVKMIKTRRRGRGRGGKNFSTMLRIHESECQDCPHDLSRVDTEIEKGGCDPYNPGY